MNNHISTKEIADEIADKIDDLMLTGEIPSQLKQKVTAPGRIVKAINEADIDVCGFLKPNVTAVLQWKAGTSEILIRRSGANNNSLSKVAEGSEDAYTRYDGFVDYSQIRSGTAFLFSEYPVGNTRSVGEVRFVHPSEFDRSAGSFSGQVCTVDYYQGRLRLSTTASSDQFISFQCQVLPLKFPLNPEIPEGQSIFDLYSIRTPHYAVELLVHTALMKIVPKNSRYYRVLAEELRIIQGRAYDNMPVETGVIQLESDFFDDF